MNKVKRLLGTRLLIEILPQEVKTNVILTDNALKQLTSGKPIKAKILQKSKRVKTVEVGEHILLSEHNSGIIIDKNLLIIRTAEIIAIVE